MSTSFHSLFLKDTDDPQARSDGKGLYWVSLSAEESIFADSPDTCRAVARAFANMADSMESFMPREDGSGQAALPGGRLTWTRGVVAGPEDRTDPIDREDRIQRETES